jgi:hypothetical protein
MQNEYETLRDVFVSWLLLFNHFIGTTDRKFDRVSTRDPQSPSPKTCDRNILRPEV